MIAVIQYTKITIVNITTVEIIILLSDEFSIIRQTQTGTKLHMMYFYYPLFQLNQSTKQANTQS